MPPEGRQRAFSSAAGLIQYYDMEESRSLRIDPYFVLILGIGAAILVEFLNWRFA